MLIRLFLASILCLLLGTLSAQAARPPYNGDVVYLFEIGKGHCSATAIGPHTILTADHCLIGDVRAVQLNGQPAIEVVSIVRDGADHAIVRLAHTFKTWAPLGMPPKLAQPVYIRGNPDFLRDQLRFGRVSGFGKLPPEDIGTNPPPELLMTFTFYDVSGTGGDSGSAVFDLQHRLVGVVSIKTSPATAPLNLMGSLPLRFTKAQWEQARR